jgi:hypothetical protein
MFYALKSFQNLTQDSRRMFCKTQDLVDQVVLEIPGIALIFYSVELNHGYCDLLPS